MTKAEDLAQKIRLHCLDMTNRGGGSHIGSCFSCADIIASLYGGILRYRASEPAWAERDRFILSKGHAGAALYAALAESGFFPISWLETHYQDGSKLMGHTNHHGVPGVELSTGSLGHGLSVGCGIAYGLRADKSSSNVYCLLSDGECDEGSVWEAALFAAHHKLSNLIAVIDYNKIQSLGRVSETLALEPFADKWRSFGWDVCEVDGHDSAALDRALARTWSNSSNTNHSARCVIAHTVKGKGVSFMEDAVLWHYRSPQDQEYKNARTKLMRAR